MRPGCYDPVARLADMDVARVERSLCFPYITRFAGQWFLDAADKDLALLCVQAYNDWMIDEWCGDSGGRLIPLDARAAVGRRARGRRGAAHRREGLRAITFTEMPSYLGLPSIHDPSRYWDPLFHACDETGTVLGLHIGSGSKMADVSAVGAARAPTPRSRSRTRRRRSSTGCARATSSASRTSRSSTARPRSGGCRSCSTASTRCGSTPSTPGIDPIITEPPSSYVAGRIYGSFFDDDCGIEQREPHRRAHSSCSRSTTRTRTPPGPTRPEILERLAAQVSAEELERIARGNALEMLGLEDEPRESDPEIVD